MRVLKAMLRYFWRGKSFPLQKVIRQIFNEKQLFEKKIAIKLLLLTLFSPIADSILILIHNSTSAAKLAFPVIWWWRGNDRLEALFLSLPLPLLSLVWWWWAEYCSRKMKSFVSKLWSVTIHMPFQIFGHLDARKSTKCICNWWDLNAKNTT